MFNKIALATLVTAVLSLTAMQFAQAQMGMGSPEARAAARAIEEAKAATMNFSTDPLIDPNTATAEQLAAIEGLSEAGAQAVIDGRPFATPRELHAVISEGMSEEDLLSVYTAMFVKVNLNRGESEDFELVPSSMSPAKVAREFDEYRPYREESDFTREMSKYVSDEEVAFLMRYVIID